MISRTTSDFLGAPWLRRSLLLALPLGALAVAALLPAGVRAASIAFLPTDGHTGPEPTSVELDDAGNLYTANLNFGGPGGVTKITPAGTGSQFGGDIRAAAGVAVDAGGNLFVTSASFATIDKLTPDGTMNPALPWPVSVADSPNNVVMDQSGNLYTAGINTNRISKISPSGAVTTPFALTGNTPGSIAIDTAGNLYTSNFFDTTVDGTVTKVTPDGATTVNFAPTGQFPGDLTTDPAGNVYVVNRNDNNVTKITPNGQATTPFAATGTTPFGIAIDSAGNLFVSNFQGGNVTRITPAGVSSALIPPGTIDGSPDEMTIDSSGNLYVTVRSGGSPGAHADTVARISPDPGSSEIAPAPPNRPAAPTATAGKLSASVSVPANPASARYGKPSSYTVTAVEDPSKRCTVTPPSTICTVTGLTAGTAYTFTARANLNSWQTGPSATSAPVKPTASVTISSPKAKVTRNSVLVTSKVRVSGAGKIAQRATTKNGKKTKTWCRASKTATQAGTYALKCNLGKKGRAALRKSALKLTLRTTFTPTTGSAVTADRKLTLKRKR